MSWQPAKRQGERMNKHSFKDTEDCSAKDVAEEKIVLKTRTAPEEASHLHIVEGHHASGPSPAIGKKAATTEHPAQHPPRPSKAREILQTVSMMIPIVGACGTLFVW